jgi:hypothetical protein
VNIVNTSIEALLSAPGYVKFLESCDSGDSGTVCPNGDPGKVLPPQAYPGNINGNSGYHHGQDGANALD